MAISKRGANVLIVALLLLLLYALNPSSEDFQAWRSSQARGPAAGSTTDSPVGSLARGEGTAASAATGPLAGGGYERRDYYLCSTYFLGGERYLGVARLFARLK